MDLDLRDWLLVLWSRALAAHLEAYWLLLLWGLLLLLRLLLLLLLLLLLWLLLLLLLLWLLRLHVVLVVVGCGWLFSGTSTAWILQVILSLFRVPLVFLLLVPLLVRVRHVVVLLLHLWRRLRPHAAKLLRHLAKVEVGVLPPHLGRLVVGEEHEGTEGSFGSIWVLASPFLTVPPTSSLVLHHPLVLVPPHHVVLVPSLLSELLEHGLGDLVKGVPPPAQLLGHVQVAHHRVRSLHFCPADVGEVEEARKWLPGEDDDDDVEAFVGTTCNLPWRVICILDSGRLLSLLLAFWRRSSRPVNISLSGLSWILVIVNMLCVSGGDV